MKHKGKDLMKCKQALRGEIYSYTVAYNTATSDEKCWRFLRKVFPYRSHPQHALLFSLLSVTMKHKGKDYEKQRSIAWTNIFIHCRIQHSKKGWRFWQKVFPHSLAFLAPLYILLAVYIGKDYLACDKIQDNRISTHQDLQHCIAVLYKWYNSKYFCALHKLTEYLH